MIVMNILIYFRIIKFKTISIVQIIIILITLRYYSQVNSNISSTHVKLCRYIKSPLQTQRGHEYLMLFIFFCYIFSLKIQLVILQQFRPRSKRQLTIIDYLVMLVLQNGYLVKYFFIFIIQNTQYLSKAKFCSMIIT